MFEKRVIPGKTYCVTAYCPIVVSSVLNNTEVILVDTSEPGQYFFVAPTTTISSSISPNYILEVKGGGAGDSGNSGSGSGVGISFEKVADFDSLPETGKLGTIYLVPTEDTDNQWTEYVYIDGRYEIIGSKDFTGPDLKNYAKLDADNIFTGNTNTFNGTVNATGLNVTDAAISNSLTANSITASSVLATTDATIDGSLIITGELITDGTGKDFQEILDAHIDDNTKHVSAEERALLMGAAQRDADNTFTAANTFTGAVDMRGASVTPPEGWNVGELTPEAIQQVVPIAWDSEGKATVDNYGGTAFGVKTLASTNSTALGYGAEAYTNAIALGYNAKTLNGSYHEIVIGQEATANNHCSITVGSNFGENVNGSITWHSTKTEGTGSITIGAGANTLNNGDTESSNSVTIGCKASNTGADNVVIGAQASGTAAGSVVMGAGAASNAGRCVAIGKSASGYTDSVFIGCEAWGNTGSTGVGSKAIANGGGVALGFNAFAGGGVALGHKSSASVLNSVAVGQNAKAADIGATVIRSTAEDGTYTQLYFSGANTPLANTYEGGEAMMGYVVRDSAGNVMTDAEGNAMVGTQKLSVLFPNNRGENAFTPAMLGLDDEWTPKPMFRPSDLDMPQEEPTEPEMEEYQPLPVYPIVEPEIEEPIN